eukprot:6834956-Pyramimonas_sp.AAC.1
MFAIGSHMEGGCFPTCSYRPSAVHIRLKNLQQSCFGTMSECLGATATIIRGAGMPGTAF